MTTAAPMDAQLQEVVEELDRDPRREDFAVPPERLIRGILDGSLARYPGKTSISNAERELTGLHRSEAAYLLRVAHLEVFHNSSESARVVFDEMPFERKEGARRAKTLLNDATTLPDPATLLRAHYWPMSEVEQPSAEDLLYASLSLENAPSAWAYMARLSAARGHYRSALYQAEEFIHRGTPAAATSSLAGTAGWALCAMDQPERAVHYYAVATNQALEAGSQSLLPIMAFNQLALALQLENRVLVERLFDFIETRVDPHAEQARELALIIHPPDQRAASTTRALSEAPISQDLADRSGPAIRAFIHALS